MKFYLFYRWRLRICNHHWRTDFLHYITEEFVSNVWVIHILDIVKARKNLLLQMRRAGRSRQHLEWRFPALKETQMLFAVRKESEEHYSNNELYLFHCHPCFAFHLQNPKQVWLNYFWTFIRIRTSDELPSWSYFYIAMNHLLHQTVSFNHWKKISLLFDILKLTAEKMQPYQEFLSLELILSWLWNCWVLPSFNCRSRSIELSFSLCQTSPYPCLLPRSSRHSQGCVFLLSGRGWNRSSRTFALLSSHGLFTA